MPAETLRGEPLFEVLHHLNGLNEAHEACLRGFPSVSFHESFQVTQASEDAPAPVRYRMRMHAFAEDDEIFAWVLFEPIAGDDRLRAEIHGLEERLARMRTFKHDISNTLMGLMGHSELLTESPNLPAAARAKAEKLLDHTRRIRDAVEGIGEVLGGSRPPED